MQTIKMILKPSGSVADFLQDFNIYQGSFDNYIINVAVPTSVLPKNIQNSGDISTVAVNIGMVGIARNGKEFQTEKHNLVWKKDYVKDGVSYKLYGSTDNDNLDDFTQYNGRHTLVVNIANIIQGEGLSTPVSVITSQECTLNVLSSAYLSNEKPINVSELDKTNANVNYLLGAVAKLPLPANIINKYDTTNMPAGKTFAKDGYKEPTSSYYPATYLLPITPGTTALKQCVIVANPLVPDSEAPAVIAYQTELAYFDGGVCKRTNKFNISQSNIGNYTLLENGEWEIVNQKYIDNIKNQGDQNSTDIEFLKRLHNTGIDYLGEYPSQETVPTDSELAKFVLENFKRQPQNGDEMTFVQIVVGGTDVIYLIKFSEITSTWTKTAYPTIEPASNSNKGIIAGTNNEASVAELAIENTERKVVADIKKGEILDVLHLNESAELESLSIQANRNSSNITTNAEKIESNANTIATEIARAVTADEENASAIITEVTRATGVEQANANSITAETTRAEAAEELLASNKLSKSSINENYMQGVSFSLNGDTNVATAIVKNPVSGENKQIEISVIDAASSTNTGLMTSEMVQSLTRAVSDIESLKYLGRQLQSFPTYIDAEVFDWSTIADININDYFIVQIDESRIEPSEHNKTTKYNCIDKSLPITSINSFRFQSVVTTVVIQVSTETSLGGVLSVNANGYVFVEPNGAMKLVGYDAILTSIANLTTAITDETTRAMAVENLNADAIAAEKTRAELAEAELAEAKADKSDLPTKTSELVNDSNFATTSELPTKTSQLTNDTNFAITSQIPTKVSQLIGDGDLQIVKDILLGIFINRSTGQMFKNINELKNALVDNVKVKAGEFEETIGTEV